MSSGVTYQHMQEHGPFYNDAYSHIPRMLTFNPPIHIRIIFFLVEQPPDQTGIYYNLPENHSIQKTTKNWYAEDYISNGSRTCIPPESRLSSPSRSAILQSSVSASSNKCAACNTPTWSRIPPEH